MDILDELNAGEPVNSEAAPETPVVKAPAEAPAEQPEAQTEERAAQPRAPDGKFAPKEQEQPVMVPLQALHETRDKVKTLEAQIAALAKPQPEATSQVPDIFENPEGFTGHIQNQIAQATINTTLNISEEMARGSVGNEVVDAAQQWAKQAFVANPALAQQFFAQRNPYGFLVNEFKRQQVVSKLGNADPARIDAFLQWEEAQTAPPPAQAAQAIPDTLATAQSARGAASGYQPPSLDDLLKG